MHTRDKIEIVHYVQSKLCVKIKKYARKVCANGKPIQIKSIFAIKIHFKSFSLTFFS